MWTGVEMLHPLQDLRLEFPFLETLSAVFSSWFFYLIIPICLVFAFYWCIDKRQGEILGLSSVSSMVFAMSSKIVFAQPRPWDLDPGIIEVEGVHANGYSLPSGHTAMTVASFIPAAVFMRRRWFSALMAIFIVGVVSSRLILCVHTPLDIIAGAAVGLVFFVSAWKVMDKVYDDDRMYHVANAVYTMSFTLLFAAAVVLWGAPLDDVLRFSGFFYGMMAGRTLDRIYLRYEVPVTGVGIHVQRFLTGMIAGAVILLIPAVSIPSFGYFIGGLLMMIWGFYLYPKLMGKYDLFLRCRQYNCLFL